MPGESGSSRAQSFATVVTALLAIAAFIQGIWNRSQGASTDTASAKSYDLVGQRLDNIDRAAEQRTEAVEKLWEAVNELQNRSVMASATTPPPPAGTPHPPVAVSPGAHVAHPLGQLQLERVEQKSLPPFSTLKE
jgi:hypothetical protein